MVAREAIGFPTQHTAGRRSTVSWKCLGGFRTTTRRHPGIRARQLSAMADFAEVGIFMGFVIAASRSKVCFGSSLLAGQTGGLNVAHGEKAEDLPDLAELRSGDRCTSGKKRAARQQPLPPGRGNGRIYRDHGKAGRVLISPSRWHHETLSDSTVRLRQQQRLRQLSFVWQ